MLKEQPFSRREPEDEAFEFENLKVVPRGYPEITAEQAIAGVIGFVLIGTKEFYYSRARGDFIPVLTSSYCFGCKDFDAKSSMIPSKNDSNVFAHESCCTKEDGSRSHQGVEFEVVLVRETVSKSIAREKEGVDLPQMRGWDKVLKDNRDRKNDEGIHVSIELYEQLLENYDSEFVSRYIKHYISVDELVRRVHDKDSRKNMHFRNMEQLIFRLRMIVDLWEIESIENPQNSEDLISFLELLETCFFSENDTIMPDESIEDYQRSRLIVRLKILGCLTGATVSVMPFINVIYNLYLQSMSQPDIGLLFLFIISFGVAWTGVGGFYLTIKEYLLNELNKINSSINYFEKIFEPLRSCIEHLGNIRLSQENPEMTALFHQKFEKLRAKIEADTSEELSPEGDPEDFMKEKKKILDSGSVED